MEKAEHLLSCAGIQYIRLTQRLPGAVDRKKRAACLLKELKKVFPQPATELHFRNPYELLVATILAARATDKKVNEITPALFKAYPDAFTLARATPEEVYPYIQPITYPRNKARYLVEAARILVEQYGGRVPDSVEELQKLPGVGPKTAQMIVAVAFNKPAFPVDTHVFRVAHRVGLVSPEDRTRAAVEKKLKALFPKRHWTEAHHLMVLHGRYTCKARKPLCASCVIRTCCRYYEYLQMIPPPLQGLNPERGTYFCARCGRYFNEPATRRDKYRILQPVCPFCGAFPVYDSRTGDAVIHIPEAPPS